MAKKRIDRLMEIAEPVRQEAFQAASKFFEKELAKLMKRCDAVVLKAVESHREEFDKEGMAVDFHTQVNYNVMVNGAVHDKRAKKRKLN